MKCDQKDVKAWSQHAPHPCPKILTSFLLSLDTTCLRWQHHKVGRNWVCESPLGLELPGEPHTFTVLSLTCGNCLFQLPSITLGTTMFSLVIVFIQITFWWRKQWVQSIEFSLHVHAPSWASGRLELSGKLDGLGDKRRRWPDSGTICA